MVAKLKTISAEFSATKVPIEIKESNLDNLVHSFGDTVVTKYDNYAVSYTHLDVYKRQFCYCFCTHSF